MKDPAVLFYTKDFLTGTSFFSDAERGQYIRLLCEQHQNGHIPENHMLTICFSLGSPVAKKFIKDSDGNYYNERMEIEILKRQKFCESRSLNGSLGGRPKNDKKPSGKASGKPSVKANGKAKKNLRGNANNNINNNINKEYGTFLSNSNSDFIDIIIQMFSSKYYEIRGVEYFITNKEKERSAAAKLLNLYKKKYPQSDSRETLFNLEVFFNSCLLIEDPWLNSNMGLPIILNQINQINQILKNGNQRQKSRSGATFEEIAAITAKHFASDSTGV